MSLNIFWSKNTQKDKKNLKEDNIKTELHIELYNFPVIFISFTIDSNPMREFCAKVFSHFQGKKMTNNLKVDNYPETKGDLPIGQNVTFNITLEQYLMQTLGPKHLALSTVIPLTVIYVFIFVTGVLGNISVCAVIVKNTSLHTTTNYYLFSLAVSDLTMLLLGLPNDLSVYWQQYPWALGVGLCKVRALVSEMMSYTSVLTIVAFSTERYLAICHPLYHYAMSGLTRAVKIIGVLWIVSFVGAAPFAVYTTVNYSDFPPGSGVLVPESGFCAMLATNIPPNWPIYEISSLVFFLLPMVVILILYIRMGIRIRKRGSGQSLKRLDGLVHETKISNSRKAIIRMLAAVVVAFFLCWAPFHAQRLLYLYAHHFPNFPQINEWMYHITGIFYYISSTVNPILYNVMSTKYRLAFKKTLCGFKHANKSYAQETSLNNTNRLDHSCTYSSPRSFCHRSKKEMAANGSIKLCKSNSQNSENANFLMESLKTDGIKTNSSVVVVTNSLTKKKIKSLVLE